MPAAIVMIRPMILNDRHETRSRLRRLQDWIQKFDQKPHSKHSALQMWRIYDSALEAMFTRAKMAATDEEIFAETQEVNDAVELLYFFSFLSASSISLDIFHTIAARRFSIKRRSPTSILTPSQGSTHPLATPKLSSSKSYLLSVLGNGCDPIEATMNRIERAISMLRGNCLLNVVLQTPTASCYVTQNSLVRHCARVSKYSTSEEDGEYAALKAIVTLAQAIVKDYSVESKAFRRLILPHIEECRHAFGDGDETKFIDGIFRTLDFRDGAEVVLRYSLVYFECGKIDMARRLQGRVVRLATMEGHCKLDISDEILLWARAMLATSYHDLNGPGQRHEAMKLREMVVEGRQSNYEETPGVEMNSIKSWELYDAFLIALSNLADSCDEVPSQISRAIGYREKIFDNRQMSSLTVDLSETQLRLGRSYFQGGWKDKSFDQRLDVANKRKLLVDDPP